MNAESLERMILSHLPDAAIQTQDLRGDGTQLSVLVTSKGFEGKTRLDQHRMVYAALHELTEEELELLSLKTAMFT